MEEDLLLIERQKAELEFVAAAYTKDEAWHSSKSVYRRFITTAPPEVHSFVDKDDVVVFLLELQMPTNYPAKSALRVLASIEEHRTSNRPLLIKAAYDALPKFLQACRDTANSFFGEEAVFAVFNRADEWIQEEWWTKHVNIHHQSVTSGSLESHTFQPNSSVTERLVHTVAEPATSNVHLTLGRRLIYSHHIISKKKRSDLKDLAGQYHLTGYVKVGWPGLIIVEGRDDDCDAFYDTIRRWAWKFLVVRGEMQEEIMERDLDFKRRFKSFLEVDEMSIVAKHCREVGLDALFRTSMKVYNNDEEDDHTNYGSSSEKSCYSLYGALVHVDHMNEGKAYRQWLRRTSQAIDNNMSLMIKQCYPNNDFSKRPKIIVGLFGDEKSVHGMLKWWRTSRVDVDSRGKPCLERKMKVLIEGELGMSDSSSRKSGCIPVDCDAENKINSTRTQIEELINAVGGQSWVEAMRTVWEVS